MAVEESSHTKNQPQPVSCIRNHESLARPCSSLAHKYNPCERLGCEEGTEVLPCSHPGKYFSGGAAAMVQVGLATAQTGSRHCEPHVSASSS